MVEEFDERDAVAGESIFVPEVTEDIERKPFRMGAVVSEQERDAVTGGKREDALFEASQVEIASVTGMPNCGQWFFDNDASGFKRSHSFQFAFESVASGCHA